MKTLYRLVLTLSVAAIACLAPVASAQEDLGPLDQSNVGTWTSGDGGTARFAFLGEGFDPSSRQNFIVYEGTHTHPGGDGQCDLKAWYYPGLQSVYFQYKMGKEWGEGTWAFGSGRDEKGNYLILSGKYKSKVGGGSGDWSLWVYR